MTWPVPSTWPWTMWPPRRLCSAAARSRFTQAPTSTPPRRLDRFSVSSITSAENEPSARTSTTVRHTPLTAMESPCPASEVTIGPRMSRRAASPRSSLPTTSPSSSTIPVNTLPSLERLVPEVRGRGQPCSRRTEIADQQRCCHFGAGTGQHVHTAVPTTMQACRPASGDLRRPFFRRHRPRCRVLRFVVRGFRQGTPPRPPRHPVERVERDHQGPDQRAPQALGAGPDRRTARRIPRG